MHQDQNGEYVFSTSKLQKVSAKKPYIDGIDSVYAKPIDKGKVLMVATDDRIAACRIEEGHLESPVLIPKSVMPTSQKACKISIDWNGKDGITLFNEEQNKFAHSSSDEQDVEYPCMKQQFQDSLQDEVAASIVLDATLVQCLIEAVGTKEEKRIRLHFPADPSRPVKVIGDGGAAILMPCKTSEDGILKGLKKFEQITSNM